MSGIQLVVLALVQGITEFLPISSQAHLILVDRLGGWPDSGIVMRVAVHVGTLFAVMVYFWRDVWSVLVGLLQLFAGRRGPGARLAFHLMVATVPVVLAAWLGLRYGVIDRLQSVEVIAWATLGFGIALYVADRLCLTVRKVEHMTFGGALIIGIAQALALIPGTSRSGITMTAARALGYERSEAARFSMVLSIPVIVAAGAYEALKLYRDGDAELTTSAIVAALMAFVAALAAIGLLMRWLRHASFTPFVVYRVVLGAGLLAWIYWWDAA